jgi:hypothetical protein
MTIDKKLVEAEVLSASVQFSIFLKTIFMIPIAVIVHFFGALVTLIFIPTTVYDLLYQGAKVKQIIMKGKDNGTV